ncbi:MAG: alanine racemase [bacterium]|nr:alanine racemase [bacterium]
MVKKLFRFLRNLRFRHTPLVEITISKERLLGNLHFFQKNNQGLGIAPVLKSNAYGHGLALVAKIVDNENIPFVIVDSYHEALVLRNERVRSKILIIGYTPLDNVLKQKLPNVSFTIVSLEQLQEISKHLKRPARFHLKIDTGMHRQGILSTSVDYAVSLIHANPKIILEGICSHLAEADSQRQEFTKSQIKVWNEIVERFKKEFIDITYFHLSLSSGAFYSKSITANVLRLGIGLYGIDPSERKRIPELLPVLEMKSIISGTKMIEKGEHVGYNITFVAPRKMRIAIIPAGFYEGIDRRLSNKGFIKIGDTFCPIIGRVSMNITTIDVSEVTNATLNTPVTIISKNYSYKNSIEESAKLAGTSSYDLLVHIQQGLRRRVD